jgi:hypothetical protein
MGPTPGLNPNPQRAVVLASWVQIWRIQSVTRKTRTRLANFLSVPVARRIAGSAEIGHQLTPARARMLIFKVFGRWPSLSLSPTTSVCRFGAVSAASTSFVVSGLVITAMLQREWEATGRVRFRDFYMRRFKRLMPALALMITVTTLNSALLSRSARPRPPAKAGFRALALPLCVQCSPTCDSSWSAKRPHPNDLGES